jgi:molybdate transport system ATP-binding protein
VPILYVSHSSAEVARLATTVIALRRGGWRRSARPRRCWAMWRRGRARRGLGAGGAGGGASCRRAERTGHRRGHAVAAARAEAAGRTIRVRIAAHEVILSRGRRGLSALNILRGTIADIRPGEGRGRAGHAGVAPGDIGTGRSG